MSSAKVFRDFSSGHLVESSQRISNILYLLKNNNVIFTLLEAQTIHKTKIIKIEKTQLILYVFDLDYKLGKSANVYFEILNGYYHGEVIVQKSLKNEVTIHFPAKLTYLKDRRYPRVNFDDLFIRFNLLYSSISSSKGIEIDLQNKYPYFIQEVKKDLPSLKLIYNILLANIKKIAQNFNIIIFREKIPDSYTIYEEILLKTQKTILIEDVTRTESYIQELPSTDLVNLSSYYNEKVSKLGELATAREIQELRRKDSQDFLISYLMSPIRIYNTIIGYVRVETNQFQKYKIHRLLAEEFHNVCFLFSYGLTKINIWKSYFAQESIKIRVLNLAIDGILIEIFDSTLFEYLKKNRRMKVMLFIVDKELELYCEIMRFFKRGGGYYLGMSIFGGVSGDLILLEEYIKENLQYHFF